jgi:hypothetical protein
MAGSVEVKGKRHTLLPPERSSTSMFEFVAWMGFPLLHHRSSPVYTRVGLSQTLQHYPSNVRKRRSESGRQLDR